MNQSPSAYQKTDAEGVADSESSLQKPKSQATQVKIPTSRKIQIPKKLVAPSDSKDAWKQMFGTFLHDINLKQKKSHNSEETSKNLQDPLVNITPLEIPCNKKEFKLEFYKFLNGQQSIDQMMNNINFPSIQARVMTKQIQEEKNKGFAKKIQQFRSSIRLKKEKQPNVEPSLREKLQMKQIRLVEDRRMTDAQKLGDQLRFRIQRKLQVLKDFIQERIDLRKKENSLQREEDVRNINFIKRFFDITSDYNQQILKKAEELDEDFSSYKKQIPCQKKLKQLLVKFDNVKPIVQHQEEYLDKYDFPTQGMLKHMMGQQSKDYLQELENEKQVRFKEALRQVNKLLEAQNIKLRSRQSSKSNTPKLPQNSDSWLFDVPIASPKNHRKTQISLSCFKDGIIEYSKRKNYIITKKPFYLFNKKVSNDKNPKHSKGLITMYDLRLYDYIHNKKIYSSNPQIKQLSQKFHTMVESEIEQSNDQKLQNKIYQMNYHVRKCKKTFVPNSQFNMKKTENSSAQEFDSDDGSLQSIYEVNLDNLYHQSHTLAKKLNSSNQGGFAKRLKQLMKLEEVNNQSVKTNLLKLSKSQN